MTRVAGVDLRTWVDDSRTWVDDTRTRMDDTRTWMDDTGSGGYSGEEVGFEGWAWGGVGSVVVLVGPGLAFDFS